MNLGSMRDVASSKTCEFCGRTFARNEHLTRHRRTHTSEKPFACPYCELSFPRSDVKDRHVERHHTFDDPTVPAESLKRKRNLLTSTSRSKLACDQCRHKKLRCTNLRPCGSCKSKGLACTVSGTSRPAGRPRTDTVDQSGDPKHGTAPANANVDDFADTYVTGLTATTPVSLLNTYPTTLSVQPLPQDGTSSNESETPDDSSNVARRPPHNDITESMTMPNGIHQVTALGFADDSVEIETDWSSMDVMNGFWQLPQMEGDSWLEGFDQNLTYGDLLFPLMDSTQIMEPKPLRNAVELMQTHFQRYSRAPSPAAEPREMWFSRQPRLQIYDADIVNVFLNLGRHHLASTFSLFAGFEAHPRMREELCLAMAAVGGLFCEVPGSTNIAKALYNDSRRIHLENVFNHTSRDALKYIDSTKTFILLEIYALCSGDKRSFELSEAFHANLFQEARGLYAPAAGIITPLAKSEASLILETLHILELYRAVLLLRPPTFLPLFNREIIFTSDARNDYDAWAEEISDLLTASTDATEAQYSMVSLSVIGCFSYMSSARSTLYDDIPLWRSEVVELALNRWLRAQSQPMALSKTLLYHMTHINIHADLALLQRFVQSLAKCQRAVAVENARIYSWLMGEHFKVARWHAKGILRAIKKDIGEFSGTERDSTSKRDRSEQQQPASHKAMIEPPHLPYCTYFSILILWYQSRHMDNDPAMWNACIDRHVNLLFCLRSRVAKLLGSALCELKTFE